MTATHFSHVYHVFHGQVEVGITIRQLGAGLRLELVAAGSPHTHHACGASGQCYAGICPHTGQHRCGAHTVASESPFASTP